MEFGYRCVKHGELCVETLDRRAVFHRRFVECGPCCCNPRGLGVSDRTARATRLLCVAILQRL